MDEERELLIHRWVTGAFATPEDERQALIDADIPCAENCRYLALVVRVDEYRKQMNRLGMTAGPIPMGCLRSRNPP